MQAGIRRLLICRTTNWTSPKPIFVICLAILLCTVFVLFMKNSISIQPIEDSHTEMIEEIFRKQQHFSLLVDEAQQQFPFVQEMSFMGDEKYSNEETRTVALTLKTTITNSTSQNSVRKLIFLSTQYFGEWNPLHYYFPHIGSKTFKRYSCPVHNCYVTNDKSRLSQADALLFHVRDLQVYHVAIKRDPNQIWILYSMEPAWLEITDMKRLNGLFNWTMSYRHGSDVLISYGFIGKKHNKHKKHGPKKNRLKDIMNAKENAAVWYVSNCCTDSRREDYVKRLRIGYRVDVFGGCGVEACRPAESKKCYSMMLTRYKFYLAFENALCSSYVTEKLYNALAFDIVPVVFGGVDYLSITPHNSVINAMDFENPEELADYLWQVSNNDSLYKSYFTWKDTFRSYLQPWMCDLCEKLHEKPMKSKSVQNLEDWWREGNSCKKWTADGLVPTDDNHPFPCYKKKIF